MNSIDSSSLNTYISNSTFMNQNVNIDTSLSANTPLKLEKEVNDGSGNDINNAAVNVSISMQSMLVYVHVRSLEYAQSNTEAQNELNKIFNNKDIFNFLDGNKANNGLDLKALGYEGKPITQLTSDEAKKLVSENGFFGVDQTSKRVSDFAFNISGDNVDLLKEAKKGIVKGFADAEKLWGGKLPEISYQTQDKTLESIDKRIQELLNKDASSKNADKNMFSDVLEKDSKSSDNSSTRANSKVANLN